MKKIIFATNNVHKMQEISFITRDKIELLTLKDIGFVGDIPETSPTIKGNALQKAQYIHERYHLDCFADDTGLEVVALNGAPGVFSARYAGENASYNDNVVKLLQELEGTTQREARFITVIALILEGEKYFFEGIINGHISTEPAGKAGFGYDPVFVPEGYNQSFAQLSSELKNSISHRAIATQKLIAFLNLRL
jgi:XTP/dITP diphosphohydrolase